MHVGVIGGTGHISSSIVRVLLAQGHAVTCVNRGLRGLGVVSDHQGARSVSRSPARQSQPIRCTLFLDAGV